MATNQGRPAVHNGRFAVLEGTMSFPQPGPCDTQTIAETVTTIDQNHASVTGILDRIEEVLYGPEPATTGMNEMHAGGLGNTLAATAVAASCIASRLQRIATTLGG